MTALYFGNRHFFIWGGGGWLGAGGVGTPTNGLRYAETTPAGTQTAATQRSMQREERVTVQGPVKKQQPDGMSHRGLNPKSANECPCHVPTAMCVQL